MRGWGREERKQSDVSAYSRAGRKNRNTNAMPSMLRGEAHPLLYVAVHSDEMERMIKDRNGTVQASELDSVCSTSQG